MSTEVIEINSFISQIFNQLGRRACPIYQFVEHSIYPVLVGTGIPILTSNFGGLITATHVIDSIEGNNFIVGGSHQFYEVPKIASKFATTSRISSIDVDVSALALPSEVVYEMSNFYHFTLASELGQTEDFDELTFYGLVGCPYSKNKFKAALKGSRKIAPYFYVSRDIIPLDSLSPNSQKMDGVHFALKAYFKEIRPVHPPKPNGISGCGVWKVKIDPVSRIVLPPQLVGVGIEYHKKADCFVATHIGAAATVLTLLDQALERGVVGENSWFLEKKPVS
jgi:hypothetical protein